VPARGHGRQQKLQLEFAADELLLDVRANDRRVGRVAVGRHVAISSQIGLT
jgi:hypothetical protein